jgi:gamma-glutamyltranspeptidase/glutathione hydrolase
MSPSFLETDDRIAVLGTPGGSRIITMVLLAALAFHEGGDAQAMVDRGRFHHQYLPDKIIAEPSVFSAKLMRALSDLGHQMQLLDSSYGNMHVIVQQKESGKLDAASDRRGGGEALVDSGSVASP